MVYSMVSLMVYVIVSLMLIQWFMDNLMVCLMATRIVVLLIYG